MSCRKKYSKSEIARMNFLHLVLFVLFLLTSSSIFSYDKITRVSLAQVPIIQTGKKCIWHITTPLDKKYIDYVRFQYKNDTLCFVEDKWLSKFVKAKNGLFLLSSENPNCFLSYEARKLMAISYDLQLNDSVSSCYNATGLYCGKYDMCISGTQNLKLIGIGQIVENQKDTIDNIMLFVKDNIEKVSISSSPKDGKIPILKNELTYFWIDASNQHVVLKLNTQEFISDSKMVSKKSVCYRYLRQSSLRQQKITDEQDVPSLFSYSLKVSNKTMSICYECLENCDIKIQICDITGILYHRREFAKSQILPKGELILDLSRLHSGVYVCYINFNGQVYSKNFHL